MSKGTTTSLPIGANFFPAQRVYGPRMRALSVSTNAQLFGHMQVGVGEAVAGLGKIVGREISAQLRGLSDAFTEKLEDPTRRIEMFRRLGQNAQRSVSASYGQLVTRQEGPASATHYRAGEGRLANGVLRRALNNKEFFTAGPDGLLFGNVEMLDREAKHWHRLAFGAGERGEGSFEQFDVTLDGLTIASLGFNETASPGFLMPSGLFADPSSNATVAHGANARGADVFFPLGGGAGATGKKVPTQGIVGKPFLEAGLRRLARDLPVALERYNQEIVGEALVGVGYGAQLETRTTVHAGSLRGGFTRLVG